jgi:hypothetical protein
LPETTGVDFDEVFLFIQIGGFSGLLHEGILLSRLRGGRVSREAGRRGNRRGEQLLMRLLLLQRLLLLLELLRQLLLLLL